MFITFEGADGSGKTTQLLRLAKTLTKLGYPVVTTREPGGTKVAEKIRDLLLHEWEEPIYKETEALLYAGARAQHVEGLIKPALEQGHIVLCDRFIDSSLVYQGMARGLGQEEVLSINRMAIKDLWPDCTFVIDIPVEVSKKRMSLMGKELDRLEQEQEAFKEKIREGYLALSHQYPERLIVLDGCLSEDRIEALIWAEVQKKMR